MNKAIYNKRLIKFAEHLQALSNQPEEGLFETVTIVALVSQVQIPYDMKYPAWVFDELVAIFDEWEFSESTGEPILRGQNISSGTFGNVCDFFDLSLDELSIFDLEGFQLPGRFGSKILNFESTTQDVAFNIMELAKSRILGYGNSIQ